MLKLWGRINSINVQKVLWALAELKVPYERTDAGMGIGDVVKITSFLTRHENFPKFAQVRAKFLGSHRPASTLLVISSLARPEFLVEVEAIAAKAPAPRNPARRPSARRTGKAKRRTRR